jgi:hypothetical protein
MDPDFLLPPKKERKIPNRQFFKKRIGFFDVYVNSALQNIGQQIGDF